MRPRKKASRFVFLASPHRIVGEHGAVKAIEVTKTRLGAFDTSGRRRPVDTGEVQSSPCDSVILAVGESVRCEFRRAPASRSRRAACWRSTATR